MPSSPIKEPRKRGVDVIKDNLSRLPGKPGVYRMFGEDETVLYVGKAKSLKARVSSYTRIGGQTQRIAAMIMATARMEFVVTETETEALLLEASLIKSLKPRFNILLRDDKSFPYILIRRDHEAPQVLKYRGSKQDRGDYFGPFASANAVTRTIDTLQKAFLLRTCEDSVYSTRQRPCMLHQIKRCSAPCVGLIDTNEYQRLADQAADFLRGKATDLQAGLAQEMEQAAETMEFERAASLRDRIRALAHVRAQQDINPDGIEEADIFSIAMEGGLSAIQVFFIRAGQNWGATIHFPRHEKGEAEADILSAFLVQFYDKRPPPRLILTNHDPIDRDLIAEALELKANRRVEIRTPQRGEKRSLVEQA
ncbi:MAG: excinuclease ABC subunit UvrC, partial [Pseudomonadota bacterium]